VSAIRFDGVGSREAFSPVPLNHQNLFVVGVKNNQLSSARDIHNIEIRIRYTHDDGSTFTIRRVRWQEKTQIMHSLSVDLEANKSECFPVFMEGDSIPLPQSAIDEEWRTRDLKRGRWAADITVTADDCQPIVGRIEFTIFQNEGSQRLSVGVHPPHGAMLLPVRPDSPKQQFPESPWHTPQMWRETEDASSHANFK
jgi:hypothetical protein